MMLMSHLDENGNGVFDDIVVNRDDLEQILAEPGVNREQVLNSIQSQGARKERGDWAIVGGLETIRQWNAPDLLAKVEMMIGTFNIISKEDWERYKADPRYTCTVDGYLHPELWESWYEQNGVSRPE